MRSIELIKPGTYTAENGQEYTFSFADLRASAQAYNPALSEAPLVIGHPKTDDPAYGWVSSLAYTGGSLEAEPHNVDPAFASIVEAGRYKKVSAAFYVPTSKNNPTPGVYYLKHVGFLGAVPPAVKGLRTVQLALGADDMITVELSEPPPRRNEETTMPNTKDDAAAADAAQAAAAKRLADNEAAFAERVKAFESEKTRLRHNGIVQFAAEQVKATRVLPKDKPGLIAFMDAVPADLTVELAEGDKQDGLGWLRTFIAGLPAQVQFGEHARAESDQAVNKSDPIQLADAALKYQREQEKLGVIVSTSAAVHRVRNG